eukprot:scaffold1419_cov410-Prasinococcus_capsulatus_cf.AAC.4
MRSGDVGQDACPGAYRHTNVIVTACQGGLCATASTQCASHATSALAWRRLASGALPHPHGSTPSHQQHRCFVRAESSAVARHSPLAARGWTQNVRVFCE